MTTEETTSSSSYGVNTEPTTEAPNKLQPSLLDGYDLPVFGLDNGQFYAIHLTALGCIAASFVCVMFSLVFSFRQQNARLFYKKWAKSDRFVVYMALCDGIFNVAHSLDHSHIIITKDHVRPKELCIFYGFNLSVSITSQMLLVNIIAINAFMIMYFNININFGRKDWKLLLWTYGVPFVASVAAIIAKQFGPSGLYCYFDGVNGIAVLWFMTIPTLVIMTINIVLYALTWRKIHQHVQHVSQTIGQTSQAAARSARSMSLFVAAFIVQSWMPLSVYSAWALVTPNVPIFVLYIVVIFSNIGGCLNLAVFVFIRRSRHQQENVNSSSNVPLSTIS